MAERQKNKKPKAAEAEPSEGAPAPEAKAEDALARAPAAPSDEEDEGEDGARAADGPEAEDQDGEQKAASGEGDESAEGDEEDAPVATQLGTERYVLAGFFAMGMLVAYVIGRAIETIWSSVSNKDWFSQAVPHLAAVSDDDKSTLALIVGGIIAFILVLRTYRRPDMRTWTDEVASELVKVKWPTRKEVSNSTVIVIAASTVATLYLMLLDRLWAFVTNIVYGDGS
jgi:preprotein translocase subunit SecE